MRQETLRRLISLGLLVVLIAIFSFTSGYFFTSKNILALLRDCAIVGILSIGVTFAIITEGTDISVGGMLGLVSMICANMLYYNSGLPGWAVIILAIVVGIAFGAFNGFIISVLKVPDFIATLSSMFIFKALQLIFSIHTSTGMISNKMITNRTILTLGGSINGVYFSTIAFIIIALVGQFILKRTQLGINIYAIGSNRKSAELSGISFIKTKMAAYMISGFCVAIAALFLMGKIQSVTPETGVGLEFQAIAAVVIGGCAFSGGRGDVIGSIIGVLFMAALGNGLYKYNISMALQVILSGAIITLMLMFDAKYNEFMKVRITRAAAIARMKKEGAA